MSPAAGAKRGMRRGEVAVWAVVILLAILHQDLWAWSDRTLVFGVVPIGLFYHAVFSVACAVLWACAVKFAWPEHIEEWASEDGGLAETHEGSQGAQRVVKP